MDRMPHAELLMLHQESHGQFVPCSSVEHSPGLSLSRRRKSMAIEGDHFALMLGQQFFRHPMSPLFEVDVDAW